MPRPFPVMPRGPRRARKPRPAVHLLGCPRVAPDWELGALQVLMKPKAFNKGRIQHRPSNQRWPAGAADVVEAACRLARERLEYDPRPHFPREGDFHMVVEVADADLLKAHALAVVVSSRLPRLWFVLGRLYLKGGTFFRRERGWKLNLVRASNVHLPRPMRQAIRAARDRKD